MIIFIGRGLPLLPTAGYTLKRPRITAEHGQTPAAHRETLSFLSMIAHFGTIEDVTVRDLRLELLFQANDATRSAVHALA